MSNKQLSNNLSSLRRLHHFTQDDVSEMLHISRQAYSNYEKGKRTPDLETLIKISVIYHISLDELVLEDVQSTVKRQLQNRHTVMDLNSGASLFLTSDEMYLLRKYRNANTKKRSFFQSLADSL